VTYIRIAMFGDAMDRNDTVRRETIEKRERIYSMICACGSVGSGLAGP
jgi:hypothetical protein